MLALDRDHRTLHLHKCGLPHKRTALLVCGVWCVREPHAPRQRQVVGNVVFFMMRRLYPETDVIHHRPPTPGQSKEKRREDILRMLYYDRKRNIERQVLCV